MEKPKPAKGLFVVECARSDEECPEGVGKDCMAEICMPCDVSKVVVVDLDGKTLFELNKSPLTEPEAESWPELGTEEEKEPYP